MAGTVGAHAYVILLICTGRDGVDAIRMSKGLVVRYQRSGGVLRNHQPGVETISGYQHGGEPEV